MRKLMLLPLLLLFCFAATAQAGKSSKKEKQTVDIPPPDLEQLQATKIEAAPAALFDTTAAPNDELTREIRNMLTASEAVKMGIATAEALLKQQMTQNENEELARFFNLFLKEIKSPRVYRLFENIFVKIYRSHFTLAEAKALNEFYSTPLGKKTIQVMPVTMQESQLECGKLGQMLAMEIYQQMQQQGGK